MKRSTLFEDIKSYLLARRETLRRCLAGELANIGSDPDDESMDDEVYVVIAASESKELEIIQAALDRFRNGSYGKCQVCQQEISSARLQALPCASLCIECQRTHESPLNAPSLPVIPATYQAFDWDAD